MADTNSLQLGKVSMRNYKAYRGDVSVEMSLEQDKTITIIHGEMGKGKTTLLEAIYWCLYGEERSATDSDDGILNSDVLNQLEVGGGDETSVEISLHVQGELRYKIKRAVQFDKKNESAESRRHKLVGGSLPSGIEITENVEYSELPPRSDDWMVLHNSSRISDKIENLFPRSLSSYFLFDAELLDKFFKTDDEILVRNGIEKISGIPVIDNATKHLKQSSSTIRKDIKEINLDPITNQMSHWEQARKESKATIDETDSRLNKINAKIEHIEYYLRNHSEELINSTQGKLDAINYSIKKINDNRKKNQHHMNDWILSSNVMLQLKGVIECSIELCDAWEKEGKIPIAVSKHTLNGILHNKPPTCICGASLDDGSTGRRHIEDLLGESLAESPVIQNISTGRGHWADMVEKTEHIRDELAELRAERSSANSEYDTQNAKRKECGHILEAHNVDEVKQQSQSLRDLIKEKRDLDGKKAMAQDKMARAEREYAQLEQKYDETLKRTRKYESQRNRIALAQTLSTMLSKCCTDLIEEMRNIVAKRTEKYFFRLVSNDNFANIEICPDYKTVAVGHDGKSKSLSAGQSCCLALSYIASIRDIAEKNYFMVIDSPFHNISQDERVGIAQNLPKFIPGTQLTFLVQDQEYTGHAQKGIIGEEIQSVRKTFMDNKSLWREYLLEKNKELGDMSPRTTIKVVEEQ